MPTTPVNRKRSSPVAETDEEKIVPTTPVKIKRGKGSSPIAESSDEEPVGKKGRYVNNSKSLGGKSDPFIDSDDDGDRGQNIHWFRIHISRLRFTDSNRKMIGTDRVFPEEIQQL